MGGVVCRILVRAQLRFNAIPADPTQLAAFDTQMRKLHEDDEYAQSIVNETDDAQNVCNILAKHSWTDADRQFLLDVVNEICGSYP
jgi:hypothetical protein